MKRRLKSTENKREELLKYFNGYNEIPFEKVIEIVFDIQIPENYNYLPDTYPYEIRKNYLRLNTTVVLISDLAHQYYQTYQRITKLHTETSKEDKELKELIKKHDKLEEAITPLISQLLDLIKNIKESGFDISKN